MQNHNSFNVPNKHDFVPSAQMVSEIFELVTTRNVHGADIDDANIVLGTSY